MRHQAGFLGRTVRINAADFELIVDYLHVHTDGDEPAVQSGLHFTVMSRRQKEGVFIQGVAGAAEKLQRDGGEDKRVRSEPQLLRRSADRAHLIARLGTIGDLALTPILQFFAERLPRRAADAGEIFAEEGRLLEGQTQFFQSLLKQRGGAAFLAIGVNAADCLQDANVHVQRLRRRHAVESGTIQFILMAANDAIATQAALISLTDARLVAAVVSVQDLIVKTAGFEPIVLLLQLGGLLEQFVAVDGLSGNRGGSSEQPQQKEQHSEASGHGIAQPSWDCCRQEAPHSRNPFRQALPNTSGGAGGSASRGRPA